MTNTFPQISKLSLTKLLINKEWFIDVADSYWSWCFVHRHPNKRTCENVNLSNYMTLKCERSSFNCLADILRTIIKKKSNVDIVVMEKQFNRPHRFCPKLASTKILPITGNQVSDCLLLQLLSKFWLSIVNSACGFGYRQHLSRDNLAFQSFTTYVWPGTSREKMPRQRWSLDSSRFCLLSGFVDLARREMFYWTPHSSV